ncbi:MAG TPA: MmcQ/YjbR family DNA-binding protein [Bacteroidia bacterium]|nr:MmcQ/YjbR family DNA-binding protein [Bacteroidia bacterium]
MDIEEYRSYCISKPGVTEEFPFDSNTLVFKVAGKMFALSDIANFESINLKCDPELAVELRERYPSVTPGYHMNKKHWNTIAMDGTIENRIILQWIDHSYSLVVSGLPRKTQAGLKTG